MYDMQTLTKSSIKITVSGRVQGVGYRYFIARFCDGLGITGYAKNMWNGDVEICAEGRKEFLEELARKAKAGPRHSVVESCKVEWLEFKNIYDNFETL
jgi:acylphosphatase